MSTSPIPDPFQLWREALGTLEKNVNTAVTGGMESRQAMSALHQVSALSLGFQQAFEKAIGSYLSRVNLPSRKEVAELAAAVQRVEEKLDRVLEASGAATGGAAAAPRPARTRRPPEREAEAGATASKPPARKTPPAARQTRRKRA